MKLTDFIICTVTKVENEKGYMFAVNGDNRGIMCHIRQGAGHLTVTPAGECFDTGHISILPDEKEKIALVRDSNDPNSGRAYTHARLWVPYRIFDGARFAAERMDPIHEIAVRAIAVNHRNGSRFTGSPEQVLFEGTFDELEALDEKELWTMRGTHSTSLRDSRGKTITLSHNTKWEVRRGNKWEHCGSVVAQTGLIDEKEIRKLIPVTN
jgi:hypothetical protein